MDRRSPNSLRRDYGVPMQDPNAFSLQYYKDTSRDPSKPKKPAKKTPDKKVDYTDHTGLLKIQKPKKAQLGMKLPEQAPDRVRRAYVRDPEMLYPDKFNTKLTPEEETKYQQWLNGPGKNAVWDQPAYDVRGSWKEADANDADGHGSDKWKKPNHPTFSTESVYANQRQYPAATWGKDGEYIPSTFTRQLYDKEYYRRMFGREPHRPEHLGKYKKGGLLKKAGYGAKLGLLGMGQYQDKAPQPTKRNAPADKVHDNIKIVKRKKRAEKMPFAH